MCKNKRNFTAEMEMPALRVVIYSSYQISQRYMEKYIKRAAAPGLKCPMSEGLSDDQLYKQLLPKTHCLTLKPHMFRNYQKVTWSCGKKGQPCAYSGQNTWKNIYKGTDTASFASYNGIGVERSKPTCG